MDKFNQRNNSKLKSAVMRRVYFFWFVKQFRSPLVLNAILFWAFASTLGALINFTEILTNFMLSAKGLENMLNFVASALAHAGTDTLISFTFTLATGILMVFYFTKRAFKKELGIEEASFR